MTTKVQKKPTRTKKLLKNFLKQFIRIDRIPFTDDGRSAEYCVMYVFGLAVATKIYIKNN